MHAALDHLPFCGPPTFGRPLATAVPADATYLNSDTFKQRLILNALTSPNIFLGGDLATFVRHAHAAEASLALLAMRIMADQQQEELTVFTLDDAVCAVTVGPAGANGQDFLGYHRSASLLATINRGLHRLIERGSLPPTDRPPGGRARPGQAPRPAALRY